MENRESFEKDSAVEAPRMEEKAQDETSLDEAFDFEQTLRKLVQRCVFRTYFDSKVLNLSHEAAKKPESKDENLGSCSRTYALWDSEQRRLIMIQLGLC